MSSKKKGAVVEKILLGRPGNNLQAGIVGLPNVGKSSFFNVLCGMTVPAENFPFCTIDPSVARVALADPRSEWLNAEYKPAKHIPAYLKVVDIAGLVKGAHAGSGLGNNFLADIRATDGIIHMVRAFKDEDVVHVEGDVDPVRDLEIISSELRLKDIEAVEKLLEHTNHAIKKSRDKVAEKAMRFEIETYEKLLKCMKDDNRDIRFADWQPKEVQLINPLQLLTAKPVVYCVNLTKKDFSRQKNKWLAKIKEWIDTNCPGEKLIPLSVCMESEAVDSGDRDAYFKEAGVPSMLDKIVQHTYSMLNLIHFFTVGKDEVRSWTVRKNCLAPQAAGTIHTDFEKGFVSAETMSYEDRKTLETEAAVKAAGRLRLEGKNYVVQDGDILHIKANTVGLKK